MLAVKSMDVRDNFKSLCDKVFNGETLIISRPNELIKDSDRNGLLTGIGKPEPLKHRKACSRRITDEHRLIYYMDNIQNLIIYSCKYHYED